MSLAREVSPMLARFRMVSALFASILLVGPVRAELRFAQTAVDLGGARAGHLLTHQFPFVNDGPGAIEITETRATCGCLKPRVSKQVFQPGESGEMVLEVNTLSQPAGPNTWRAFIRYREGSQDREVPLQLAAQLLREIHVQPAAMTMVAEGKLTHEVSVTDSRSKPLAITAVHTSSPHLKAAVIGRTADAQGHVTHRIRLALEAAYPEGRHEDTLSIFTDDPAYAELRVVVTVLKRPRQQVIATPSQATLSAPAGQPIPSKIILLRDAGSEKVEVEAVTVDDPAISCKWAPGPGPMTTLRIQVDRARLSGNGLLSAVHVQVRQPMRQTVTIPVSCTLR